MKKLLSAVLALTMILSLTACGAPAAEPDPEPDSEPTSDAAEAAPEPATLEGVVKEVSPDQLIITLADGSNVALATSGIAGLEVEAGDTVKAEYTGAVGAMTASKVEVTAKAEKEIVTVSGVVTGLDDEFVYLTLEDGTDAALRTVSMEEGEVEEGDTLTIHYTDGGGTILSIDVTKAEKEPEVQDTAASQAAQGTPAGNSGTTSSGGTSSGSGSGSNAGSNFNSFLQQYSEWAHQMQEQQGNSGAVITGDDDEDEDYTPSDSGSSGSSDFTDEVYEAIRLINNERSDAGLPKLDINSELMEMAQVRADEMVVKFEHVRPDGSSWKTVFEDFGSSLSPRAENGGKGKSTASAQVASWMSSTKGHKENILDSKATMIGVARHGNCWTMILAY